MPAAVVAENLPGEEARRGRTGRTRGLAAADSGAHCVCINMYHVIISCCAPRWRRIKSLAAGGLTKTFWVLLANANDRFSTEKSSGTVVDNIMPQYSAAHLARTAGEPAPEEQQRRPRRTTQTTHSHGFHPPQVCARTPASIARSTRHAACSCTFLHGT